MKEIGGYIELDRFRLPMLYDDGIKLNCGRNALRYLLKSRKIKTLWIPKFICDSCIDILKLENIKINLYDIGIDFRPIDLTPLENEWVYIINYYGQLSNDELRKWKQKHNNLIVDNAQAYFQEPLKGVDTLYTCRKFFGVPDGAILFTDSRLNESLPIDESFDRIHYVLGRFERCAEEFYNEFTANNAIFKSLPIMQMSKLTDNLLHGIDYNVIMNIRTNNFTTLHESLMEINKLNLEIPKGAFMYPLYIQNGYELRKKLQANKIYIPMLWPSVMDLCRDNELVYDMAMNILPIPVDQRYSDKDMMRIVNIIKGNM